MNIFDPTTVPSPYYRVATRAIVLDDQEHILVMENHDGGIELPGGGWEFDESFEICLERELQEELGVGLKQLGDFVGLYRGRGSRGIMYLRIAYRAGATSHNFRPQDMKTARFITREEFMLLDMRANVEEGCKDLADQIWSLPATAA